MTEVEQILRSFLLISRSRFHLTPLSLLMQLMFFWCCFSIFCLEGPSDNTHAKIARHCLPEMLQEKEGPFLGGRGAGLESSPLSSNTLGGYWDVSDVMSTRLVVGCTYCVTITQAINVDPSRFGHFLGGEGERVLLSRGRATPVTCAARGCAQAHHTDDTCPFTKKTLALLCEDQGIIPSWNLR